MTSDRLTGILAEKVMRWRLCPERFLLDGRQWKPRWHFQPFERTADALKLLEAARPDHYNISGTDGSGFAVEVRISGVIGRASSSSQARSITLAIARALGIEVEL